jgi:hypothetical protein
MAKKKKPSEATTSAESRTAANKARRAAAYGKQFNRASTRAERRAHLRGRSE